MKKMLILVLVVATLVLFVVPVAFATGATVDQNRFPEGQITEVETPSGKCIRSHQQSGDPRPDPPPLPDPGHSPAGGNFTDFSVGGGELEFGLQTPSDRFSGQSHHPC